ncbi:sugar ABC transporter substrate-binding protein (plasmid) [Rhodococcus erythropolis]|uniref:sugar ABC transporter substrate-binding protein n=1 Tax=Rhodococcus erythropolis TaxID=1833 RepID=UPI00406BBE53
MLIGAALVGCSSASGGSGSSGSELSAAEQQCVDNANSYFAARNPLPDTLPSELTTLTKKPTEGLTITRIFAGAVPIDSETSQRLVDAAPVVGWTGKAVAYDGSVEDANRKTLEAVNNSDVVAITGVPAAALRASIQAAKEKGVLFMIDSEDPPESVPGFGATPLGGDMYSQMGEPAAYAALRATNCQGSVAVFGVAAPAMRDLAASINETMKKECADCGYSYTELPFSDIGSPSGVNAVTSKLQADPSVSLAFFTIGDLAKGIEPALKQAGIDVKVAGALANTSNLSSLKQGRNAFWLGVPQEMSAWITLDTALRALDSGEPTVGNHYPVPVFTQDNIATTDEVPVYPADFKDRFAKLWQVAS